MKSNFFLAIGIVAILILFMGCAQNNAAQPDNVPATKPANENDAPPIAIDRESKIPSDAVKMAPETDSAPPKSISPEYSDPVTLPYPISTAGAEDSAFIMPDGKTLYFFFTPDVRVPVEKQV
ncbi:MAG: hypothetical protein PHD95_06365, partial [Candidatus ainarchaeum sp.]|nr:hypothetical protein [Candidatus ainarchaeum sp.]